MVALIPSESPPTLYSVAATVMSAVSSKPTNTVALGVAGADADQRRAGDHVEVPRLGV
jgi:hypothetical protein